IPQARPLGPPASTRAMKPRMDFGRNAPSEVMTSAEPPQNCARGRDGCKGCKVRLLSVCAALDCDELGELEELALPVAYPPKATLFMQGEPADNLFNVMEGTVRL